MNRIKKYQLLIIDDVGLQSHSLEESRDFLEVVEARYNKGSLILSSQLPHEKWYDLFSDPTIADAIMDRVSYNSYIINLESKISMRQIIAEKKMKFL
ncbi:MAG: ATP-binding protein [Peptostreptococcaceae bacterium]|nr:ATP-binding protein [Peptostreptococcaceae bacterium]